MLQPHIKTNTVWFEANATKKNKTAFSTENNYFSFAFGFCFVFFFLNVHSSAFSNDVSLQWFNFQSIEPWCYWFYMWKIILYVHFIRFSLVYHRPFRVYTIFLWDFCIFVVCVFFFAHSLFHPVSHFLWDFQMVSFSYLSSFTLHFCKFRLFIYLFSKHTNGKTEVGVKTWVQMKPVAAEAAA